MQSGIHFDQIDLALEPQLEEAARATAQRIKRAHVLGSGSRMEGGAHVILEAVQSGTPVLASHISGNLGMLGTDYAGYFEVGDDAQLAALFALQAEKGLVIKLLNCSLNGEKASGQPNSY